MHSMRYKWLDLVVELLHLLFVMIVFYLTVEVDGSFAKAQYAELGSCLYQRGLFC